MRKARGLGAVLGGLAAAVPMLWLRGFSVDDALITARVAAHISSGFGHRFNEHGPVVDAVTPLGFEYALSLFSKGTTLGAFYFAKWFGAVAWLAAAAWLGQTIASEEGPARRLGVLVPLALSVPLAAWSVSGMETGIVVSLATAALSPGPIGLIAASLAAALRPELIPWAVALAVGRALSARRGPAGAARALVAAIFPAAAIAAVRLFVFGHVVPLAFFAKPSDFGHGFYYVAAALLWTGAPCLVLAPGALRRLDADSRVITLAAGVHVLALVLAGGDWMAFFRLFVPVMPGLFLVGSRVLAVSSSWIALARLGVASAMPALIFFDKGSAARDVLAQRLELIDRAGPALSGARAVAALDVGWVGAATDAEVIDLAGVTDESIAHLPGGHTSKRLPPHLLEHRHVDALVLLVDGDAPEDWRRALWARAVEARVAREAADLGFVVRASLELRGTRERYLVLRLQNRS